MSGGAGVPLVVVVLLAALAWIVFFRCNSEVLSTNPTENYSLARTRRNPSFIEWLRTKDIHMAGTSSGGKLLDLEDRSMKRPQNAVFSSELDPRYRASGSDKKSLRGFDITLCSQGPVSQLESISHLLDQWTGPMSIAVYMSPSEYIHYRDKYPLYYRLKRLIFHPYISSANSLPTNHLRNLAILNATTSHVWVMDLDMIPSDKLYERLYDLPLSYLRRTDLAIVVPVFSVHYMECSSVSECEKKLPNDIPHTKKELKNCIRKKQCVSLNGDDSEHDYLPQRWFNGIRSHPLDQIRCRHDGVFNPFIVVRKSPFLPSFDERFVNSPLSQAQWIEHLRYRGYSFSILMDGFAVALPPSSSLQSHGYNELNENEEAGFNRHLYDTFLKELAKREKDLGVVYRCK